MPELKFIDRAKETTETTGEGPVVLGGASNGFVALSGIGNGNSSFYVLDEGSTFEVGRGTYNSGDNTFSRDTVLSSSNDNNKISLGGTATIFLTYPADFIPKIGSSAFSCSSTIAATPISRLIISTGLVLSPTPIVGQFAIGVCDTGLSLPMVRLTSASGIDFSSNNTSITGAYTANDGLTLVGNEFNTAGTGTFEEIKFSTTSVNITAQDPNLQQGDYNVSVGFNVGYEATGNKNVLIGRGAGTELGGGSNNIELVTDNSLIEATVLKDLDHKINIAHTIIGDTASGFLAVGDVSKDTLGVNLMPAATLDVISTASGDQQAIFRVQGSEGELISINNNLSTGVIFSVSDVAGLPLIAANASGDVTLIENGRYVGIATGTPQYQLDVAGTGNFANGVRFSDGTIQTTSATGDISIVSGLTVTNATNIASTGETNAASIATNATNISTNTTNIASTGATNAAAIAAKDNYQYWTVTADDSNTKNITSTATLDIQGWRGISTSCSLGDPRVNIQTDGTGNFAALTFDNNVASISDGGDATFNNITATGNFNVSGTLTYIDSTTVTIADKQLELASNSGTAIGNDATVNDGGIVVKSTEGDKKWTWQNNAYWDEWLSSEHVAIAADKALRLGPTCAGSPGRLMTFNWTNRGNLFLGNPGSLTVPGNASGWLIMNHGLEHNGGVITGVKTLDAENLQIFSGDFRHLSVSGTPMTMTNVDGEAQLAGMGSISVLPDGATAPLEIKGASNAYISFPDGTTQTTSATGCCSGNSDRIDANFVYIGGNTADITTIENSLADITGCGLSCTGVTGSFDFDELVTFNSYAEFNEHVTISDSLRVTEYVHFHCGDSEASITCTGNGNLNIPSGNVYANNVYQTGYFYDIDVTNNAYFTSIGINQTNILSILDIRSINITDIDLRIQQIANQTANLLQINDVDNNNYFVVGASGDVGVSGDIYATGNISLAPSKSFIFGDSTTQVTSATGDISTVSGLTVTNATNIASTGATNATAIATNTTNIATNVTNIASTGATNAANITTVSGLVTTYTAGTGLTLVGTEFNTAGTGNFKAISFASNNGVIKIGDTATLGDGDGTDGISIGQNAGHNGGADGSYHINIGANAGRSCDGARNIHIGYYAAGGDGVNDGISIGRSAGQGGGGGNKFLYLGYQAGYGADGKESIYIGQNAGKSTVGENNIELVTCGESTSILDDVSNKIHIENTIVGDTDARRLAIGFVGSGDVSPDATLEIKPSGTATVGMIVQAAASHTASLTEWQDSSETVLASVAADGAISASGAITAATGVALQRNTPATTTDKLYNVGGALYFNGSAVDGDTTYTAGTGLTLVGTEFNTANTGNFKQLTFNNNIVRIGDSSGDDDGTESIHIGTQAGMNTDVDYGVFVGYLAGKDTTNQDYAVSIGFEAGYSSANLLNAVTIGHRAGKDAADLQHTISIGKACGFGANSEYSLYLGYYAGAYCVGDYNIEILTNGVGTSILDDLSNKINIQNTIIGDTATKKLAIGLVGVGDVSPDATLEIKPNATTDVGLIVQGASSQSANLTEWQDSSETVLAYVDKDGSISGSANLIAATGIIDQLQQVTKLDFNDNIIRIGDSPTEDGSLSIHIGDYAGAYQGDGAAYDVNVGYYAGYQSSGDYNITMGYAGGYQMDPAADYNVAIGYYAGYQAYGDESVYIGYKAGYGIDGDTDADSRRVAIGSEALLDGYENDNTVAIGYRAGHYSVAGYDNVAIGDRAGAWGNGTLRTNSNFATYQGNTAIGHNAFYNPFSEAADSDCLWNTVVGYQAGYNADDNGDLNFSTFLGARAGYNCEQAYGNTAVGLEAFRDSEGSYNTAVGYQAGRSTTNQDFAVSLGYRAGYSAANLNFTVDIGYKSCQDAVRVYYTSAIGYQAGRNADSDYSIFLGYNAGAYCVGDYNIELVTNGAATSILDDLSNKIHIENTIVGDTSAKKLAIGNVGVGDVVPDATLEVKPSATTDVGLIVQGASSHTANLTEWQNSSETVLAYVDVNGSISGNAIKTPLISNADGATITFDLDTGNTHAVTLGDNRTLAISNESPGQKFMLRLVQDATGGRTVTWFSTIKWAGGSAPTLTATANKADVFGFLCTGTDTYDGFVVGQNI